MDVTAKLRRCAAFSMNFDTAEHLERDKFVTITFTRGEGDLEATRRIDLQMKMKRMSD